MTQHLLIVNITLTKLKCLYVVICASTDGRDDK